MFSAVGALRRGGRAREADLDMEPDKPAGWRVKDALTGLTGWDARCEVAVLYLAARGRCELPPLAICADAFGDPNVSNAV